MAVWISDAIGLMLFALLILYCSTEEGTMAKFSKFYTALTAGLLTWAAAVVTSTSSAITASEWVTLGGILVTAVAVYAVPTGSTP